MGRDTSNDPRPLSLPNKVDLTDGSKRWFNPNSPHIQFQFMSGRQTNSGQNERRWITVHGTFILQKWTTNERGSTWELMGSMTNEEAGHNWAMFHDYGSNGRRNEELEI